MDVISASGTQRLSDPTQQNAVYIVNDDGDMKKDAAYIDNDSNPNVDGDLRFFREKTISNRCYYAILAGFVVLMMVTAILVTVIATKASDNASRGIDAAPSEMSAMPSFADTSCFEENIDYNGNDLYTDVRYAESAVQCQQRCQKETRCAVWTFQGGFKCWLKTSSAGRRKQAGTVSGDKNGCPDKKEEWPGKTDDWPIFWNKPRRLANVLE